VTPADASRLTLAFDGPVALQIYPDAEGEASTIVSITYERVVQHRQYSIRNAEALAVHVVPVHALSM
jgi:hypothetical protein